MTDIPSPETQNLGDIMDIAVVIKENGDFWLVHDKELPEEPAWAEFDPNTAKLYLVKESGNIRFINVDLNAESCTRLKSAEAIFLIYMKDGKELFSINELPVTIQHDY